MRSSMILAGFMAVLAVACGGSDDDGKDGGGAGTVDSGVPESTQAGALTDAQAESFCESASDAALATLSGADVKQALCGFSGYFVATFTGGDAAACTTAYDECLKAPAEPTQQGECQKPSAACTATIGELEACYNDSFAQLPAQLQALPGCDDVGKTVEEPAPGEDTTPASCQVVQEKCPEALAGIPDPTSMLGG